MKRFFTIAFVIFYIVADLTVNIFFNVWSNDISNSIFKFSIGHSTFDLLILSGLRFCILFGASIGLCCNYVLGVDRIKKWSMYVLYYSCFTALYTVVKIIYFLEDDLKNKWKMWIAISITISSVFFTYINWFFLGLKFNKKSKSKLNVETEVHMQSNSKEYIKKNKRNDLNVLDEMEAKKYSTSKTLLKLLKLAKYDAFYICIAFLFLILCSIGQVFLPFYTGLVLNYIIIDKSVQKFQDAILHLALVTLATGFAASIRAGVFTFVLSRYVLRIQNLLFSAIVKMEIAFFDERNTGEITSRLTSDCTKIGDCVGLNVNIFTRNCVKVIGILFFMFKLSWKLSLLTLVSLPIVAIVSEIFGQRYRKLSEGVQNSLANANECAQEVISSIRTVRSFAAENQEIARYSERLYVTYNLRKKESFLQTFYRWSLEITDMATSLLILFFGGDLVIKGHLIGGHLVSFILYSMELANAFDEIGDVYTGLKSSVVNLLEHFYEPSSGEIFLDGFKISSFDHEFLHSKLTLVQQEPVLFARSISENIVYGLSNNVDAEEIIKAAIMANANSFICDMPEKYETQTGEKGIQLSGGQKQRIAIARALIRNPSVLVLDEATSALDTESEYLVQQAINKNLNGRTVIIIAHRLSTVEKADNIFVFDKGTIVEEGTHAYLIKSNGVYAGLVKRQMLE
nr:ABC-type oligopeptide transporter ABCB9-like isoform X2 [Hydra vulgaris]